MKVYAGMSPDLSMGEVIEHARRVEALGYDGLQVSETVHDSLALSLLVAEHTERITIRTSVALAFVRSPTLTAYAAWDLAKFSNGRFQLGLGTQIRQNIEERYAMAWSDPIGSMRDYLGALRALFACFVTGGPINFESEHIRLSRMQPFFNPGPDEHTEPPLLYLGGVNPKICQLAGELADGFVTHPTNSNPRYLESLCRPNLERGRLDAERPMGGFELVAGTQVISGGSARAVDAERERQRRLLAFLFSTPAYRPTLDLYGWGDMGERLQAMVRSDRFDDLKAVVTDEVLDALIPTAGFEDLADVLLERYSDLCEGITIAVPADPADDGQFREVLAALQAT